VIGISTDGASPVFAQAIRAKIETFWPTGFAIWAAAAHAWRSAVNASGLSSAGRRRFWQLFATHAVIKAASEPGQADFDRLMAQVQGQGSEVENGSVTLVDAGPGDPELLTLRAVRGLRSADIILFDDRVSREVLDFARREARKLLVGSAGKEADNNSLMAGLARCGKRVVRLSGGSVDSAVSVRELTGTELANLSSVAAPGASAARNGAAA